MSDVAPLSAVSLLARTPPALQATKPNTPGASFANVMMEKANALDLKLKEADALVQQFAVDDSVPLHDVTMALERARLSVELMTHVRTRLLEAYQDVMRTQI